MAGLNQVRPHYRFATMLQKANEATGELRTLGSELLQPLEKRDAEELSLLRSRLELHSIRLNREVHDQQIKEAETQMRRWRRKSRTPALAATGTWGARRIGQGALVASAMRRPPDAG